MTPDELKRAAAHAALDFVKPGMRLGLGSGSTTNFFIDALATRHGTAVLCVPSSEHTRRRAEASKLRLSTLDETPVLDLTVDGADEIDPALRLIKGGGGAHLREKIIATSSERMIVIADESKRVDQLGAFPLPIEIVLFGAAATLAKIEKAATTAGCRGQLKLRASEGRPFVTDNGNLIYDASLGRIDDPQRLASLLSAVPGVVEHGLFIGIASLAIIAAQNGIETLEPKA